MKEKTVKRRARDAMSADVLLETGQLLHSLERTLAELAEFTAHMRDEIDSNDGGAHDRP